MHEAYTYRASVDTGGETLLDQLLDGRGPVRVDVGAAILFHNVGDQVMLPSGEGVRNVAGEDLPEDDCKRIHIGFQVVGIAAGEVEGQHGQ